MRYGTFKSGAADDDDLMTEDNRRKHEHLTGATNNTYENLARSSLAARERRHRFELRYKHPAQPLITRPPLRNSLDHLFNNFSDINLRSLALPGHQAGSIFRFHHDQITRSATDPSLTDVRSLL